MADQIPDGITRNHVLAAIAEIDRGVPNSFAPSTKYDLIYDGRAYAPKQVLGVAAQHLTGEQYTPYHFRAGVGTKCFRTLEGLGFVVVAKDGASPFPDEVDAPERYREGATRRVSVNRYERDSEAREEAIRIHGTRCAVCKFDFGSTYGSIGEGFIHVHHLVPLASVGEDYEVDPQADLVPVCPNCHAMLHQKRPPLSVDQLKERMVGV